MTALDRFRPTRAGIINLWDYRDEEFLFVDGWLVLRGPNGSGKTKALEVLFPFVLDGRIEPRRLNPFASEERTMKSNLLYRGQDVAHAYAWMEFGRATEDGNGEHVTIGIGLRAHRHVDRVTRWHFVVNGRVGVDFSLIDPDDRPLNRKDLTAELGAEHVYESPDDYRRAVDARLFGLGPARYEQLIDLVLTLRKPQLAKDLNPVELSRTLQRGLRPLDEALVAEAAGSFDDMEAVARTLEGLVAADRATAAFLSVYSTYLRTHARAAADAVTARLATAARCRGDIDAAITAQVAADAAHHETTARVEQAEGEPGRLRAHRDALKDSDAYRSQQQLLGLRRHVQALSAGVERAQAQAILEESTVDRRGTEVSTAESSTLAAATAVTRCLAELAREAETAGIAWTADDLDQTGFADRIGGRVTGRFDDIRAVRERADRLAAAERDHTKATHEATQARARSTAAEAQERAAEAEAAAARARVTDAVTAWHEVHGAPLAEILPGPDGVDGLVSALREAVDRAGEPDGLALKDVVDTHTADGATRIQVEDATLGAQRDTLLERRSALGDERDRVAGERDDAPRPLPSRRADRTVRAGAPLWMLVDFADGMPTVKAAAIEAALEAAGLLDAWVHSDPAHAADDVAAAVADGYLVALPPARRPTAHTLRDFLVPEAQGAVPVTVVEAVLASVAVRDAIDPADPVPNTISTSGQYAQGVLIGAYRKPAPEYIGATARAARRAARVAECDRLIADLDDEITALDRRRDALRATLAARERAVRALPAVKPIHEALRELDRRATELRVRRQEDDAAAARLDAAVAEQAAAAAALRRAVVERSLPVDRVDMVDAAVRRFEQAGRMVPPARHAEQTAQEALTAARSRWDEAADRLTHALTAAREAAAHHAEQFETLQTLSAMVDDADAERVVAEITDTEEAIAAAEDRLSGLRRDATAAAEARAACAERVAATQSALHSALAEADQDSVRLRPFAQRDLLSLLRCRTDLRWPTHTAATRPAEVTLPAEVTELHEAILAATKELTPTENSLKQSATRLTSAFAELLAQLPAAGLDHRPELDTDDSVIVIRIADEQGLTPVAQFAERIARERHEQEQLLSDAERRIFEDALLTQLARQIHHRTIEARDLVEGMDSQMRARRMSSGITVGVGWQLSDDLDTDQREACKLLERNPAGLGPTHLTTLRRHFATRIKAARAMAPEQPYRELLAQVLDYRQWRVFSFSLHRPGGGTEKLTRARHSQLSGGEQSVSLHLPLFAAANALFGSANATAPRMLGMDEAFAGVDENGRGELMSLATQFDLDLFMTGFDLWATHPSVNGAAHYDLSHSALENTVATVLLTWNGVVTTADFDGTLARALGSPETRRAAVPAAVASDGGPAVGLDLEVG